MVLFYCPFVYILVSFSVIGNSIIIITLLTAKSVQSSGLKLLLTLAFCDLSFSAAFIAESPQCISKLYGPSTTTWHHKVNFYLRCGFSVFTLIAIAIERYLAVMKPFYHKVHVTKVWIRKAQFISFIVPFLIMVPGFITSPYNHKGINNSTDMSSSDVTVDQGYLSRDFILLFELCVVIMFSIVPALILGVLYGRIIYRVWFKPDTQGTNVAILKARRKITKLLLMVTIVFYICILPLVINTWSAVSDTAKAWISLFPVLNTALNPVIYNVNSPSIRQGIKSLFTSCLPRIHHQGSPPSNGTASRYQSSRSHGIGDVTVKTASTPQPVVCLSVKESTN